MQLPEQPHSPGTGSSVEISIRLDHTQVLRMIQERFIDWHHRASASSWKGSAWLVILITRPFQHSGRELPLRVCGKPQFPAAAALALAPRGNNPLTSRKLPQNEQPVVKPPVQHRDAASEGRRWEQEEPRTRLKRHFFCFTLPAETWQRTDSYLALVSIVLSFSRTKC